MIASERNKAKKEGKKTYYTGRACKNNHLSNRRTDSGSCVECQSLKKEQNKARQLKFKLNNTERLKEIKRNSANKIKKESPERRRKYHRDRMKLINSTTDGKLYQFIRGSVRKVIKGKKKERSIKLVGYSKKELKTHLESKFKKGMTWDNYGDWHIDHIIPVSYYIKNDINDPKIVNRLSNLQPLWAKENISKGAKILF